MNYHLFNTKYLFNTGSIHPKAQPILPNSPFCLKTSRLMYKMHNKWRRWLGRIHIYLWAVNCCLTLQKAYTAYAKPLRSHCGSCRPWHSNLAFAVVMRRHKVTYLAHYYQVEWVNNIAAEDAIIFFTLLQKEVSLQGTTVL